MSGDTRTANGLVVSRTGDVTSLALRPQQLLPRGYVLLMPIAIQDAGYTGGAGGAGQGGHNGHASHDTLLIYESLQSSTVSRQSRVRSKLHRRLAKLLQRAVYNDVLITRKHRSSLVDVDWHTVVSTFNQHRRRPVHYTVVIDASDSESVQSSSDDASDDSDASDASADSSTGDNASDGSDASDDSDGSGDSDDSSDSSGSSSDSSDSDGSQAANESEADYDDDAAMCDVDAGGSESDGSHRPRRRRGRRHVD